MKFNILKSTLLIITIILLNSCSVSKNATSTITGVNYDKNKDETHCLYFPFGDISIPGKWTKSNYNKISRQQFFKNKDSITISIVLGRTDKYQFNRNNDFKNYDFVKKYYEWDTEYLINSFGLKRELFEEDKKNNLIIYRLYGEVKNESINTFFLVGNKNGNIKILSVLKTNKWNKEQKIKFLKKLYLN